ncbi:BA75_01271T0 [Komagataella pastoris]|uniref:BA75_01271T0 n=1 Tax=Komagataella pastoris TaxID=4922 RepID=A0A1B2J591_PICPA|nr:BA75_01271T0 [Komagataella pastoris]
MDFDEQDFQLTSESQTQEVFETSDAESVDNNLSTPYKVVEDPDVSNEPQVYETTKERFLNEIVSNNLTDFSDRITSAYRRTLITGRVQETTDQRLLRIQNELYEIQQQKKNDTTIEGSKQLDRSEELLQMVQGLDLKDSENQGPFRYPADDSLRLDDIEFKESEIPKDNETLSKLINLDHEVAELEKIIGFHDDSNLPITLTLSNIHKKLALLQDPEGLDSVKQQLTALNEEAERVIKSSKKAEREKKLYESSEESTTTPINPILEAKIHTLYDKITSLPRYEKALPSIIDRLKTFQTIQVEAESAIDFSKSLRSNLDLMNSEMKQWEATLDKLEKEYDNTETLFEQNKNDLDQMMNEMDQRLSLLESKLD